MKLRYGYRLTLVYNFKLKELKSLEIHKTNQEIIKGIRDEGRKSSTTISRPSHLEILVLRFLCVLKFLILEDKTIFFKLATVGHKKWID